MVTTAAKKSDSKSANNIAMRTKIADLGFTVEDTEGGKFIAHEVNGDRGYGPTDTISALHTLVKVGTGGEVKKVDPKKVAEVNEAKKAEKPEAAPAKAEKPEMMDVDSNLKGEVYLFGSVSVPKELYLAGVKHARIKDARVEMTKKEVEAKNELLGIAKKYKDNEDLFEFSAGGTRRVFEAAGLEIELDVEESWNVKTTVVDSEVMDQTTKQK